MNNTNDNNAISPPLLSSRFFCERFYGMEMFCPIGEDSNLFQRVKIIDHSHFQIGDKILEYGNSIDQYLFKNLERFTSENDIFNPEYYIEGERYVNYSSGHVAKLKKFTPTELTFTNGYLSDIHRLYRKERTYSGYAMESIAIWLRLGKNRINDIISDKQVISKDKLIERHDSYIPSIIIHDLEKGIITRPRMVSSDRTEIELDVNNEWISIHDDRYKYYQIKKTKSRIQLKAINIDDLKSDCIKSFDVNAIGEHKLLVIRTVNDEYFVSNDQDAEKISAKNEDGKFRDISADEVSAIYVIDISDIGDIIQTAKIIQIRMEE